jgi:hypothetical protein
VNDAGNIFLIEMQTLGNRVTFVLRAIYYMYVSFSEQMDGATLMRSFKNIVENKYYDNKLFDIFQNLFNTTHRKKITEAAKTMGLTEEVLKRIMKVKSNVYDMNIKDLKSSTFVEIANFKHFSRTDDVVSCSSMLDHKIDVNRVLMIYTILVYLTKYVEIINQITCKLGVGLHFLTENFMNNLEI